MRAFDLHVPDSFAAPPQSLFLLAPLWQGTNLPTAESDLLSTYRGRCLLLQCLQVQRDDRRHVRRHAGKSIQKHRRPRTISPRRPHPVRLARGWVEYRKHLCGGRLSARELNHPRVA